MCIQLLMEVNGGAWLLVVRLLDEKITTIRGIRHVNTGNLASATFHQPSHNSINFGPILMANERA